MSYSDNIQNFLDFLRQAKRDCQIAITEEKNKDDESQDLDHHLELNDNSYHDMAKIAKKRAQVRQERRQAKDRQQQLTPITDWISKNTHVINSLEQLLGAVRQAEKGLQNRTYHPKTKILDQVFKGDKHHE